MRLLLKLRRLLLNSACQPRRFKLVPVIPLHRLGLLAGQPSQHKAKARELGVAAEIPARLVLVRRLVIVLCCVVRRLRAAPLRRMAFKQIALIDRESWYAPNAATT